ncbi:unnamed protein product [Adineta ricciae]|uniref:G-protein coupled receptors family 1 profile domain-containing protein n=1 Tax=Adineta ricciae TaxID=249248 RepID=A0A815VRG5_ADIRI|nr:unnamed protein product [Adineta ricciae]
MASTNELSTYSFDNSTMCADQLISEFLDGRLGRITWGILQIVLTVFGDIGNILTLIVLNQRLMRKGGVNNLLQGLAISDIVAPTFACIPHLFYYYGPRENDSLINFINLYVTPIATGATFCSNWIVVTITSFRLLIVLKPLYSQVYCSSRNEKKVLIIISMCSILSITPYYYYHRNPNAMNVLRVISAVLSLLCPWVVCVILWILLLRIVNREIGTKRSNEFTLHPDITAQRLKSKSRITKMILIICFFNIICQLPVLILTVLSLLNENPCTYASAITFVCLLFLSNILLIVNHSINFVIYSLTNTKFRCALKIMCRRLCSFYHHRLIHQQITISTKYDKVQNKIKRYPRSNSNSYESPRLVISMRSIHSTKYNMNKTTHLLV